MAVLLYSSGPVDRLVEDLAKELAEVDALLGGVSF
jgi:hypothetical protein